MKDNKKESSKTTIKTEAASSKTVLIRFNSDELAAAKFLEKATKRSFSGAVKWAAIEKAEELGFKPKVTKDKK